MPLSKDQARSILRENGLRSTGPRIAVLRELASAKKALSYSDVLERLGETDWDPATIYRNLVKLKEAGIASIVSRAEGISRYALSSGKNDEHQHPHFVCDDCGEVSCLPSELTVSMKIEGSWSNSIAQAMVQLRGECPDCLEH